MLRIASIGVAALACVSPALPAQSAPPSRLLLPDAVWDGTAAAPVRGWAVLVTGETITAVGPLKDLTVPKEAERVDLRGTTLIPGLIEGHSHLLLHPYDETPWDQQVLKGGEPVR